QLGFTLAEDRRRHLTSVDKANVLASSRLWREVVDELAPRHPSVTVEHALVDSTAYLLMVDPHRFDVIVTENLFGDILSDLGAGIAGGLGLTASGNIHPGRVSMFEPVHGSAPDIAGQDRANPFAAVLTSALMLRHLGHAEAGDRLENAVRDCILAGETTGELGGTLGTQAAGDAIVARLRAAS
ncbi:MAG TPA: isocitrate/isopropylmalate family dehydrogenase, partial [Longimicrobium sp.]|nr:isocitrate/isopropylmalate family dehydrogenase [Longimicrobium sp.]